MVKKYFISLRYLNPWASGVTTFGEFIESCFIIIVNCEKMKIEEGKLQVRMKFKQIQSDKQILVWMPVFQKKLIIDKNMDVSVS